MSILQNEILDFCKQLNIECVGFTSVDKMENIEGLLQRTQTPFCQRMDINDRINPGSGYGWAKSAIVYLLPYFNGYNYPKSNISMYAHGRDYHTVANEISQQIIGFLKEKNSNVFAKAFCDDTKTCQRELAFRAGLGFYGKNHCLINEKYGSYFFICHILTDMDFETTNCMPPTNIFSCKNCAKCVKACPTGILKNENPDFNKCLSNITQKKDELSSCEIKLLKENSMWGCDACQKACPHNQGAKQTPLDKIFQPYIYEINEHLTKNDVNDRAYGWRWEKVVKRNLK